MKRFPISGCCALGFAVLLIVPALCRADHQHSCDSLLQAYHEIGQFNGTALVAENGKIILAKGYGLANAEWGIPCDADTKFRLGSVTKQFTAMLILQLAAEGKLDLQGKLADYLPGYRKDTGGRVSIHHLLCHSSGIPSYTDLAGYRDFSISRWPVDSFIPRFCSGDLLFDPSSKFQYSNSGYYLLGAIIEKITGKSYEQNLRERILAPAGMVNTGYDHSQTLLPKRASGYQLSLSKLTNCAYLDMSVPYAAGAMYSTVNDLFLWDQALLNGTLLPAVQSALMFSPQQQTGTTAYGYGWFIMPFKAGGKDKAVIQHAGGINGFSSMVWRVPEDRHLVVLLDNYASNGLQVISQSLTSILYDQAHPRPRRSLIDTLLPTIQKSGIQKGLALYKTLTKEHPDEYAFTENVLNQLGYVLLSQRLVPEAIGIFTLTVQLYPKSANAYDSLGEAYLADGNTDLGVKNYRKSLQLDGSNQNARDILKKYGVLK